MTSTLSGQDRLQRTLKRLGTEAAKRVARRTVMAGARVVEREIRSRAPGRVKQEVGISTNADEQHAEAKVGIGVGRAARIAAVGLWLVLGTQERFRRTESGLASTGRVEPHPFVQEAVDAAAGAAVAAMKRTMVEVLEQEIARARK